MNQYQVQLVLGIAAVLVWGAVFWRWASGATHPIAGAAVAVGFGSSLIVLIFGSLRLLGTVSDDVWTLTGTVLRGVVVLAGVTVLVADTIPERASASQRIAETTERTAEQVDEIHDATVGK